MANFWENPIPLLALVLRMALPFSPYSLGMVMVAPLYSVLELFWLLQTTWSQGVFNLKTPLCLWGCFLLSAKTMISSSFQPLLVKRCNYSKHCFKDTCKERVVIHLSNALTHLNLGNLLNCDLLPSFSGSSKQVSKDCCHGVLRLTPGLKKKMALDFSAESKEDEGNLYPAICLS